MVKNLTVKELQERWRKDSTKTIYRIINRYKKILKPMKIGRSILIDIENIEKFESQMRTVKDDL